MNRKQILLILAVILSVLYPQGISVGDNVDVNGDGVVNTADLEFVDAHLGRIGDHPADVNDDNVVNIVDLMLVKNAIGTTTRPPRDDVGGMVLIPAGTFQMGSNNGSGAERPVHTVHVDAFYMDAHEVTNAEYAAFLNAKGKHADGGRLWFDIHVWNARIDFVDEIYRVEVGYENHPVVYVTWYGAVAYSRWAGKRLPTEAEWEKAARGGLVGKTYPWGDKIDDTKANYHVNVRNTTPVGSYPPNGYGLYDMAGNVAEWCLDEHNWDFYRNSPPANPVSGAGSINQILDNYTNVNTFRVLRGGDWINAADFARVADRRAIMPASAFGGFGFRCARAR